MLTAFFLETSDRALQSFVESACLEELNDKDWPCLLASLAFCAALMHRFFEEDFSRGRRWNALGTLRILMQRW